MSLRLNITSESDLLEMSVYGMNKKEHDAFVNAISEGEYSLSDYSWADEDTEWPDGVSAEILAQAQLFSEPSDGSIEVTVNDEDEEAVAEGIQVNHIFVKTDDFEAHKRYAAVWSNCEDCSFSAELPEDVEKENLDSEAFYALGPNMDSRLAHEDDALGDWFAYSLSPYNIYYIPKDKLKKLLKDNAEELGIDRDLEDDFYFEPDEDFENISWERACELLEEFRLEVELDGYENGTAEAFTFDDKLKKLEELEE